MIGLWYLVWCIFFVWYACSILCLFSCFWCMVFSGVCVVVCVFSLICAFVVCSLCDICIFFYGVC